MRFKFAIILIVVAFQIFAQKEDHIWLFGSSPDDTPVLGYSNGTTAFDFSQVDPQIYYNSNITMDFHATNASVSTEIGELLLYSNGMQIHDGEMNNSIINGDTIAYSNYWENWTFKEFFENGDDWIVGFPIIQGISIIPILENKEYIAIYNHLQRINNETKIEKLMYSRIILNSDNEFEIANKDQVVHSADFNIGQVHVCRHANGRDWWLIQQNKMDDFAYIYLVDSSGIRLHSSFEKAIRDPLTITTSQVAFNSEGSKYAIVEGQGGANDRISVITLFDFERCSGQLNLLNRDTITNHRIHGSVAFSPSGQYLYASSHKELFQYDVWSMDWKSTKQIVAEYDGFFFQYTEASGKWPTEFGPMALGPDGRIYSVPAGDARFVNVIEYPNEEGENCQMLQHKIMLPTQNFISTPNFPHYRLGPLDGTSCDSLGIDNNPIALFRYAQDSANHLNVRFTNLSYYRPESWSWDFGDETSFEGKDPFYHEYEENGAYHVCLTVNNENSENKYCKTIYVGVTSTKYGTLVDEQVNVFPNPVESVLYIELRDYIPQNGSLKIYNELGEILRDVEILNGWNHFEVEDLTAGVYFYSLYDNHRALYSGRFIKI